jgi:hypothetical protein
VQARIGTVSLASDSTESRARAVLGWCGLDRNLPLEPAFSYSNDIWIGSSVVVRCNRGRFRGAFALEAIVLGLLDDRVPHAEVIGVGNDDLGEWMVLARVVGTTWTRAFAALTVGGRRALTEQLAETLVAIGSQSVPAEFNNPWLVDALASDETIHEAHHPPVEALPALFRRFRRLPGVGLLADDLEAYAAARAASCAANDARVLVHGDIHWDNLVVDEGRLTAVLDWEGARRARAEQELDSPLRFSAWPWLPVAEWDEQLCRTEEYAQIPGWLREAGPQLFAHEHIVERLELHALAHDLVQALHFPNEADRPRPGTVWWRLREFAAGRSRMHKLLNLG